MELPTPTKADYRSRMAGLLLGLAVGDALGLPYEGLSRRRSMKMLGPPDRYRFFFGRGMVSDDTEHACMTAQSLLSSHRCPERFSRSLAWKLRWWLAALPAGTGFATLRATIKLWLGVPPARSGVYSAGNGPAMRAPVIGALLGTEADLMKRFVRSSTRLTHTDPKAERGALVVATAAAAAVRVGDGKLDPVQLVRALRTNTGDGDLDLLLEHVTSALAMSLSLQEFTDSLGLEEGVSGYVYHTVSVALYAFLRNLGDFDKTVREVVSLGGDADSTGAIAGALAGASTGIEGISDRWLKGLTDWPRSTDWMRRLAARMADFDSECFSPGPEPFPWPAVVPRNLFFLTVVLFHGFRRLLPPY
jgi:ADP-ribosylglycohydrolase